ncbi:MAG: hypothetical protein IT267_02050 [Saprospiraceae bacterium]|nr:hypothetical protein [Saprospiraceae bacterium]
MSIDQEQLPEILQQLKTRNSFLLPDSYFDSLPEHFLNSYEFRIAESLGFSKLNNFIIPTSYFENNVDSTLHLIHFEKSVKDLDYRVPSRYFEQLSDKVFSRINRDKKKGGIRSTLFRSRMWISVAALFVIVMWISLFRLMNSSLSYNLDLSSIDDDTLIEFVADSDDSFNSISEIIDSQEIDKLNFEYQSLDGVSDDEILNNL